MNYIQLQDSCLSLPHASEDMPFGDDVIAYRIGGSIFALVSLSRERPSINLKCNPEIAIELRERYEDILPGYHMNKKHWNTVYTDHLQAPLIKLMIRHSYDLVASKLPRTQRDEYGITQIHPVDFGDML